MTTYRDEPYLGDACLSTSITPLSNYRELGAFADERIRLDASSFETSEFNRTDELKAQDKEEHSGDGWGLNTWILSFHKMCSSLCVKSNAYAALLSPSKKFKTEADSPEENSGSDGHLSPAKDLNAEVIFYHQTPIHSMGIRMSTAGVACTDTGAACTGESSLLDHRSGNGGAAKQNKWFPFRYD